MNFKDFLFRTIIFAVCTAACIGASYLAIDLAHAATMAPGTPEPPIAKPACGKPGCLCGCQQGKACACANADIEGVYLTSTELGGKFSHGAATVERRGDVYLFAWTAGYKGIGFRIGDNVTVSWWSDQRDSKDLRGNTAYKVEGRNLSGKWISIPGDGRIHRESLVFLRALPQNDEDE